MSSDDGAGPLPDPPMSAYPPCWADPRPQTSIPGLDADSAAILSSWGLPALPAAPAPQQAAPEDEQGRIVTEGPTQCVRDAEPQTTMRTPENGRYPVTQVVCPANFDSASQFKLHPNGTIATPPTAHPGACIVEADPNAQRTIVVWNTPAGTREGACIGEGDQKSAWVTPRAPTTPVFVNLCCPAECDAGGGRLNEESRNNREDHFVMEDTLHRDDRKEKCNNDTDLGAAISEIVNPPTNDTVACVDFDISFGFNPCLDFDVFGSRTRRRPAGTEPTPTDNPTPPEGTTVVETPPPTPCAEPTPKPSGGDDGGGGTTIIACYLFNKSEYPGLSCLDTPDVPYTTIPDPVCIAVFDSKGWGPDFTDPTYPPDPTGGTVVCAAPTPAVGGGACHYVYANPTATEPGNGGNGPICVEPTPGGACHYMFINPSVTETGAFGPGGACDLLSFVTRQGGDGGNGPVCAAPTPAPGGGGAVCDLNSPATRSDGGGQGCHYIFLSPTATEPGRGGSESPACLPIGAFPSARDGGVVPCLGPVASRGDNR